jgi:hypothetical protein
VTGETSVSILRVGLLVLFVLASCLYPSGRRDPDFLYGRLRVNVMPSR